MDVVGLTFTVAQTILAALQCEQLKDLFGSDLDGLGRSVETIQAMLLDAESKQAHGIELSAQERNFIDQIKDVLYDADDLLDAYVIRAKRKQINTESGHKLSSKVRGLCSRFKHLAVSSPKVKKTAKKLEKIGREAQTFKLNSMPIGIIREETCSYVNEHDIVGREDDQRRIVDMLIHPILQGELPVLAIVGVGGLGKTTLAQLVYKDPYIQNEFSLRLWVCVSDQGGNQFNVKAILADIYKVVNPEKYVGDLKLEVLVQELRSKLDQNKYLLVLDDLWNEKRDEFHKLVDILRGSVERGSRILVTTRSKETANAIGSSRPYKLHGLSAENSWNLFEKKVGREIKEGHDLFEICKDIVKKCVNVPLAIKVVGSLLHDMPENKWQSFQESRLLEIKKHDNDIMQILKFSYYHLSPSLKSCFTYCAIFPKDFEIQKENLNRMWMAHDYVKDEVEAEYNFQILVQRCFFHDIRENHNREIVFNIHDLMHDMAQEIAGKEIYIENSATAELDKNIFHLNDGAKAFVTQAKIRSYVHHHSHVHRNSHVHHKKIRHLNDGSPSYNISYTLSTVLAKWRHLRVLDLHMLCIIGLPKEIGNLLHLRYLDLSENKYLRMLPEALTKLINLQFLNLTACCKLKELPRDFQKLVNLRTLYVPDELEYMPLGMKNMTGLTRLNSFIVGHRQSCLKQEDMLEDLRVLRNVKGSLNIRIKGDYKDAMEYCGKGGDYICNTQCLRSISIEWDCERNEKARVGNYENLLENLLPHRNLKELEIRWYVGVKIPRWAREDSLTTTLPNLVEIYLGGCHGLVELPWLGRLQHLKILCLKGLENVEYMENRRSEVGSSSRHDEDVASTSSTMLFFPSLECLYLRLMPKLKGWWGGSCIVKYDNDISVLSTTLAHSLPSFPRLSQLAIVKCPNLTYIPLCTGVKFLKLGSPTFGVVIEEEEKKSAGNRSCKVVGNSRSQYMKALPCLVHLVICYGSEVESVSEYEELLRGCLSSLRSLELQGCRKLRSVREGGGLEYLTALEHLELYDLPELEFDATEEMPWRCLGKCLLSLKLSKLEKVDKLPKGMRYLTSLKSLKITCVQLLKEIPEWIECLSSLQSLQIECCNHLETLPREMKNLTSLNQFSLLFCCSKELKRRCEKPDGEYCPILNHIPTLIIQ